MLRLSKKADYALIALKDLAVSEIGASSSAREIAERYNVPVELMAKVLQRLAKAGLVTSHQGTCGGYRLARPAIQISVAEVVQVIDGPVFITACSDVDETCNQYAKCNIRDPLWRLKNCIVQALSAFTIHELTCDETTEAFSVATNRHQSEPTVAASSADR